MEETAEAGYDFLMSSKSRAGLTVLALSCVALAVTSAQQPDLQRGKYLVEQLVRCQDCHTPKLDNGELDTAKWLKGATLAIAPIGTIRDWHAQSPDLTSTSPLWQRWGEDGLVKFLETARNPRGNRAGPPMPGYTMSHQDAVAIVAYLKTLP